MVYFWYCFLIGICICVGVGFVVHIVYTEIGVNVDYDITLSVVIFQTICVY